MLNSDLFGLSEKHPQHGVLISNAIVRHIYHWFMDKHSFYARNERKKTTITTNESRKNYNNNKYLTNTFWSTSNWIQFQPVHNFKVKKNNNKYNYANDQN